VPPGDASSLADAMRAAIQDEAPMREAAARFAQEASARFDSRRVATALDACFREIGKKSPDRAPEGPATCTG
jgi:hypothetical protein